MGFNPMAVITECGADRTGDGQLPNNYPGGWKKIWGTEEGYWTNHLKPFLDELNKDDYILGSTVFTVGTGFASGWDAFNVSWPTLNALAAYVPPVVEPPAPPEPPVPPITNTSKGIVAHAFSVENPQAHVDAEVWFDFEVENTSSVEVPYTALAAHTDVGYTALSWTMQKLKPGQVLKWRDHLHFNKAGTYNLYLGISYADSVDASRNIPWDRLSPDVTVTIGQPVVEPRQPPTPPEPPVTPPPPPEEKKPLFKVTGDPARDYWMTYHAAPGAPASAPKRVTWDVDVWFVDMIDGDVWFQVADSIWVLATDCKGKKQ